MPGRETVFISYRRSESAAQAGQLRDQLAGLLHPEAVFFDQDMRPGSDFPDEIKQALARVKLVLVLIGPGWLQAMHDRADGPARTDWVLEEVKAALDRLQRRDGVVLMPLLVQGAEMPAEGSLPAALGTLWRQNAEPLKAQAAALPADHDALLKLLHLAGLVAYTPGDATATLAALGSKVKALLALPHMTAIAAQWANPPCAPSLGTPIPLAIVELAKAIQRCAAPLRALDMRSRATIQASCQSLLTLMCNLTADLPLADLLHQSDRDWIAPAGHAGSAVNLLAYTLNARAPGLDLPVQLAPADGRHPVYANVLDTGVAGIGSDQTAHLHAALWAQLRKLPGGYDLLANDYPAHIGTALAPDSADFDRLQGAVEVARLLGCPVIVAHEQKSAASGHGQLRQDATALGLDYLAYGNEGLWLTRYAPSLLNPARLACQQAINNILAP